MLTYTWWITKQWDSIISPKSEYNKSSVKLNMAPNLPTHHLGLSSQSNAPRNYEPCFTVPRCWLIGLCIRLFSHWDGLSCWHHPLPPKLPENPMNQLPILTIPKHPKERAPIGSPTIQIHPFPVHDLHLTLHLRHVIVRHHSPRKPELGFPLVIRAFHL